MSPAACLGPLFEDVRGWVPVQTSGSHLSRRLSHGAGCQQWLFSPSCKFMTNFIKVIRLAVALWVSIQQVLMNKQAVKEGIRSCIHPGQASVTKRVSNYIYNQEDFMGEGSFSRVYKGLNEVTNEVVAIKVIDLSPLRAKNLTNLLTSEIKILKSLDQINILKCYEVLTSNNNCYIVTQLCDGGTLESLIAKRGALKPVKETYKIILELYEALKYLFNKQIIHRDIKTANVLFSGNVAKVADFGFAKKNDYELFKDIYLGSPLYMSPEGFLEHIYGPKSDVWSFGIVLFEMLHGTTPFGLCKQEQELRNTMLVPIREDQFHPTIPYDLRQLILQCLQIDEKRRISIDQIEFTPFFRRILPSLRPHNTQSKPNFMSSSKTFVSHLSTQPDVTSPYNTLNFRSSSQNNSLKADRRHPHYLENVNVMNQHRPRNDSCNRSQHTPDAKFSDGAVFSSAKINSAGGNRFTPCSPNTPEESYYALKPLAHHKGTAEVMRQEILKGALKTFKECLNILHYSRLCYKTIKLLREHKAEGSVGLFSSWVIRLLEEMKGLIDLNQINCCSSNVSSSEREKKLKDVVMEYITKYSKELSCRQPPGHIGQVLQESLRLWKQFDGSESAGYPLKHYLLYVCETTRVLGGCLVSQSLEQFLKQTNIEGFLGHPLSELNECTYKQMRNNMDN